MLVGLIDEIVATISDMPKNCFSNFLHTKPAVQVLEGMAFKRYPKVVGKPERNFRLDEFKSNPRYLKLK